MAYNEHLADRIREALVDLADVEEIHMFGGVCFMVNGKMCVGVIKEDMMCRVGLQAEESALEQNGCRPMDFSSRPMKGYVYVSEDAITTKKTLVYWIDLCLAFNKQAVPSRKKKK